MIQMEERSQDLKDLCLSLRKEIKLGCCHRGKTSETGWMETVKKMNRTKEEEEKSSELDQGENELLTQVGDEGTSSLIPPMFLHLSIC